MACLRCCDDCELGSLLYVILLFSNNCFRLALVRPRRPFVTFRREHISFLLSRPHPPFPTPKRKMFAKHDL
jgi:hypothetical protein